MGFESPGTVTESLGPIHLSAPLKKPAQTAGTHHSTPQPSLPPLDKAIV